MRLSSVLESSEEKTALSLMPGGVGEKCTSTVGGHFEAQKRTGAVDESVKAHYCGEQQRSMEESCDNRRHSSSTDVFTSLPLVLHENLNDVDNISFEEGKKSRRHRTYKQIQSDTKRNSMPHVVAAPSAKHSASRRKSSLKMREPEESSVLMTETHNTSTPSGTWSRRTVAQELLPSTFTATEDKPLFEFQVVDAIYPKSMRQVPISNMLNDMRNLAVRRVAAGLEPHMSGAARTRDETSGQWEDAWLILSRGILWSGTMTLVSDRSFQCGPYGPHTFHRLACDLNYCGDPSCCDDEAASPFTLMWGGDDENWDEVLPQHVLRLQSGTYIAPNSVEALLEWASVLQQAAWRERGLYCEKRTFPPPESIDSCQWLKSYFERRF